MRIIYLFFGLLSLPVWCDETLTFIKHNRSIQYVFKSNLSALVHRNSTDLNAKGDARTGTFQIRPSSQLEFVKERLKIIEQKLKVARDLTTQPISGEGQPNEWAITLNDFHISENHPAWLEIMKLTSFLKNLVLEESMSKAKGP